MPFTSSSQGAQTNTSKYFMENGLHTALTAVYTYVEEWVSATKTARIYKSLAANNYVNKDWYLCTYRSSDTGTSVGLGVSEQYNTGTHVATNYAPGNGTYTPTAQFAVNDATGKAPDQWFHASCSLPISAAGFQFWTSVTADRVIFGTRVGASDAATYVGLYDDVQSSAISPFPLLLVNGGNSQSPGGGAATREPNTTTSTGNCFQIQGITAGGAAQFASTGIHYGSETYTGKYWLARYEVQSVVSSARIRGYYRDYWYGPTNGVNGDTLTATINGSSKTLSQIASGNGGFVDTGI